jgi:hypothetical protein
MAYKRTITYILIVLLVVSATGYYLYQHSLEMGLTKPVLILKISANFTGKQPMVYNVTFEQSTIPSFYKVADSIPNFPEINVNARSDQLESSPSSFTASAPFKFENSLETYTLKVYFKPGREPKSGTLMILPIRIIGNTGATLFKTSAFYEWQ